MKLMPGTSEKKIQNTQLLNPVFQLLVNGFDPFVKKFILYKSV